MPFTLRSRSAMQRLMLVCATAMSCQGSLLAVEAEMLMIPEIQRLQWDDVPDLVSSMGLSSPFCASGDTVVFRGPESAANPNVSAAYVFVKQGGQWVFQQKLTEAGLTPFSDFGTAIAIDGDTIVIGFPSDDLGEIDEAGAFITYHRSNGVWTRETKIQVPDAIRYDRFGYTLAIDGDTIVALSHGDTANPSVNAGSAYFFERVNGIWTFQVELPTSSAGRPHNAYGEQARKVAIKGDHALIGEPFETRSLLDAAGIAFAFKRQAGVWSAAGTLAPPNGKAYDFFGTSILMNDDGTAMVSAVQGGLGGGAGKVYVYENQAGSWQVRQQIVPENGGALGTSPRFGYAMSVAGDRAMIGAPGSNIGGVAFIYEKQQGQWTEIKRILPDYDYSQSSWFGGTIAFFGDSYMLTGRELDPNSTFPDPAFRQRPVILVHDLVDAYGPELTIQLAAQLDDSEGMSRHEWDYLFPIDKTTETLFDRLDTNNSETVDYRELAEVRGATDLPLAYKLWIERIELAETFDVNGDLRLTRQEILKMWQPGQTKAVDKFIRQLKVYDGELVFPEWLAAKKFPSNASYLVAKGIRAARASAAEAIDQNDDEKITRGEFAALFPSTTKPAKVDAFWKVATSTHKKNSPPAMISVAEFIEAPKLPKLPQ